MALMVAVKLYYGDEIRVTEVCSQAALMRAITSLFFSDSEKPGTDLMIKYKDLDDDLVTLKTEADFRIACINLGLVQRVDGQVGRKTMKVYVLTQGRPAAPTPPAPLVVLKPAGGESLHLSERHARPDGQPKATRVSHQGALWAAETDDSAAASSAERAGELNKGKSYRLLARFVEHVTYPVGSKALPGEEFVKTWRVRNDAERAWPKDVELIYVSGEAGDMMGSISAFPQVGGLQPGEIYDVSANLKACTLPGTYEGFWRLRSISEGLKFGQRLRVSIQVVNKIRKEGRLNEATSVDDIEMEEKLIAGDMEKLALDESLNDAKDGQASFKLCDDFECVDDLVEGTPVGTESLLENENENENEGEDIFVEVMPKDGVIPDGELNLTGKDDGTEDVGHDIIKVLHDLGVEYSEYKNFHEMRHVKVAYGKLKRHVNHMVRQAQRRRTRKNQAKAAEKKDKQTKVA